MRFTQRGGGARTFAAAAPLRARLQQILRMREIVDHVELQRLRADDLLAGEDQTQRRRQPDQLRQPCRAAPRREDAELRLGQPEFRGLVRRRHAPVARQRELEAAAEAHPVNRGDRRHLQPAQPREDAVAEIHHVAQRALVGVLRERIQVGARR